MASAVDMVTLAVVKDQLQITTNGQDPALQRLISGVSQIMLAQMNRDGILPATYTDELDGNITGQQMLRNWPVISIQSVTARGVPVAAGASRFVSGWWLETASSALPPGAPQTLYINGCGSYLGGAGGGLGDVTYTAGYQVSDTAVAAASLAAVAPYGPWASDQGVVYASGGALARVATAPAVGQYAVDSSGNYSFNAADVGKAVVLTYGFIPFALQTLALQWVVEVYNYWKRVGVQSKSLAGQESVTYAIRGIPDFVKVGLSNFAAVV